MDETAWLGVTLCVQRDILKGFVYLHPEERLLDLLNGISARWLESQGRFLVLSDLVIKHTDGTEEKMATAYINKTAIYIAVMWDRDSGRGIGAKTGTKAYPYIEKSPVPVSMRLPLFSVTGRMYCASGQSPWQVLEERLSFLPLTNVEIQPVVDDSWLDIPFVAVNREMILALQEEDTPLLGLRSS